MKQKISFALIFVGISIFAQRFGYVDTDYVLKNLPAYQQAQDRLNKQTEHWEVEITQHQSELDEMINALNNEKIILSEEKIKEREKEIVEKKKNIADLEQKRYGPKGDLISAQLSFIKPLQDQIYNAVNKVAKRRNYGFVFDKGNGDLILIFSDPKYDISEEVLKTLKENNK